MFELVPLWMALLFGVTAAAIVEGFLFCWNHHSLSYYQSATVSLYQELAASGQRQIELQRKVDNLVVDREDWVVKLAISEEKREGLQRKVDELIDSNRDSLDKVEEYISKYKESLAKAIACRSQAIVDIQTIDDLRKEIRELKAQVQMHRTNEAKVKDELHQYKEKLHSLSEAASHVLWSARENIKPVVDFIMEIESARGCINDINMASVDSGEHGTGPMDSNEGAGSADGVESPQVCS